MITAMMLVLLIPFLVGIAGVVSEIYGYEQTLIICKLTLFAIAFGLSAVTVLIAVNEIIRVNS